MRGGSLFGSRLDRPAKKKGRKPGTGQRRRFRMPARLRWSDFVTEKSIDMHGYEAGQAGRWRVSNPTRGDPARLRWLAAWESGRIAGGWPIDDRDYSEHAA